MTGDSLVKLLDVRDAVFDAFLPIGRMLVEQQRSRGAVAPPLGTGIGTGLAGRADKRSDGRYRGVAEKPIEREKTLPSETGGN